MHYMLAFLALLVAIVGVLGDTWKDGNPTCAGYVTIVLALAVFAGSVTKHAIDHRAQRNIAAIACGQVLRGTHALIHPFAALLADGVDDDFESGRTSITDARARRNRVQEFLFIQDPNELPAQIVIMLDELPILFSHSNLLHTSSLQDHASQLGVGKSSWRQIFETARRGVDTLDNTLSSYRSTMNAKEIGAVQRLRNIWLTQRIELLNQRANTERLSDYLRLDEKIQGSDKTNFDEFLQAVKDTVRACSEARPQSPNDQAELRPGEAVRLNPDSTEATRYLDLGNAYRQSGNIADAITVYFQAITLDRDFYPVRISLGRLLAQTGRMEEAVEQFENAARIRPDSAEAHNDLGIALSVGGQTAAAIAALRESLTLEPDSAETHLNLGVALGDQGDIAASRASLSSALAIDPSLTKARRALGRLLAELGDYSQALVELRQAARLEPNDPGAHHDLGVTLARAGQYSDAVAAFRATLSLDSNHVEARRSLNRALRDREAR